MHIKKLSGHSYIRRIVRSSLRYHSFLIYSAPSRGAEFCDEYLSLCLSACLSQEPQVWTSSEVSGLLWLLIFEHCCEFLSVSPICLPVISEGNLWDEWSSRDFCRLYTWLTVWRIRGKIARNVLWCTHLRSCYCICWLMFGLLWF